MIGDAQFRKTYRPSNRVSWAAYLLGVVVSLVVAVAVGYVMDIAYRHRLYHLFYTPLFVGAALATVVCATIHFSHCRNRFLAVIHAMGCTLVAFMAMYYFDFIRVQPDPLQLNLFPRFIKNRLDNAMLDEAVPVFDPDEFPNPPNPDPWPVHSGVALELIFLLGFFGWGVWGLAGRPYGENSRRWMATESKEFSIETGHFLAGLLKQPTCMATKLASSLNRDFSPRGRCRFVVYYSRGSCHGCDTDPVYAAIEPVKTRGFRPILRPTLLFPKEVDVLASWFPSLSLASRTSNSKWMDSSEGLAVIRPIPEHHRGKILTAKNLVLINGTAIASLLLWLVAFIGGILSMLWDDDCTLLWRFVRTLALVAISGLVFLAVFVDVWTRWWRRLVQSEFSRRTVRVVGADLSAFSVIISPRHRWRASMFRRPYDIGLLAIADDCLLFEGDREAYRIPWSAIEHSRIEYFVESDGQTRSAVVLISARTEQGLWETGIVPIFDPDGRLIRNPTNVGVPLLDDAIRQAYTAWAEN